MKKFFKGLFSKKEKVVFCCVDYYVEGWDRFNSWIYKIATCEGLTEKERVYVLSRIRVRVKQGRYANSSSYWNEGAITLSCMWEWTKVERRNGIQKADSLGL